MRRALACALLVGALMGAPASTAAIRTYATCYALTGTMADGTPTRWGSAASNVLRLGTRIQLVGRSFYGLRRFTIRDTGGALGDGHLDLWYPSTSTCFAWGRRAVAYRIGWHYHARWRATPNALWIGHGIR